MYERSRKPVKQRDMKLSIGERLRLFEKRWPDFGKEDSG